MSVRPWRLLLDPPASAAWNMSLDEALLECALEQPPTLRFYTWSEPSVSLGYRQAVPAWLERCERLSVPVVRRVSGGGAVLHAGDLTYAVITPLSVRELPGDLRGSYEWIRNVLVDGLRAAGLDVQPSCAETGAERLALCFAGATGLEIELERVKLVGSAQRRTRWGFLQHGSIRLADDSALYEALQSAGVELTAVPAAAPTPAAAIQWLLPAQRNKRDTTAGSDEVHTDAGAVAGTAVVSDDTVTFSKGKYTG